ncbi:MAG: FlgD immunoglobulin-like domain containing protein, partial [Candidatus Cloacimonadaceae bacterium]
GDFIKQIYKEGTEITKENVDGGYQIVILNHGDNTATGRLYLMFYDDNAWGSYFLPSPPSTNAGGNVMYMAIDVTLPFTNISDPVNPSAVISLAQNYPNPFKNTTSITFDLSKDSEVTLNIYNIKGQLVKTLVQGMTKSGNHSLDWSGDDHNGKKVSTGLYFYKLQSGEKAITRKLLLLR